MEIFKFIPLTKIFFRFKKIFNIMLKGVNMI